MSQTLSEILTQTDAWQEALDKTLGHHARRLRSLLHDVERVLFTGCGSTYYLAVAAAHLFQSLTQCPARGVPGSELVLNPESIMDGRPTLLVAVSRSGATSETLRAVERFRSMHHGPVVAITTRGDQPLAALGDASVVLESAQEQSVVQTRSFAAMYLATTALSVIAAGDETLASAMGKLPEVGQRVIHASQEAIRPFGEDMDKEQFFFLGSGTLYGLACEGSLKLKEMSLTVSEPFHFLEFRHGPMSMVGEDTVLVGLLSERNRAYEQEVLVEMHRLGGTSLMLGEQDATVALNSHLPEPIRGVLYMPPLQLLGYYRAIAKGLDPDHPRHLSAVVNANLT